jgi:TPR repeat protein
VRDQQALRNEPLPLTVVVEHPRQDETLLLLGLVSGTTLSVGTSISPSSWQLSADKLKGLDLYAPKDFVGAMDTTLALITSDKRLLDTRAVQLKWIPEQANSAPTQALPTAVAASEADFLMRQGRQSLIIGDISAARVAFRRLANAGIANGVLALAETYDPVFLTEHKVIGVSSDRAAAKELYERAKKLGAVEAGQRLARMTEPCGIDAAGATERAEPLGHGARDCAAILTTKSAY